MSNETNLLYELSYLIKKKKNLEINTNALQPFSAFVYCLYLFSVFCSAGLWITTGDEDDNITTLFKSKKIKANAASG